DGPQVQPGAAHEQGPVPARLDAGDSCGSGLGETDDGELLARVGQVQEVVRDLGLFGGRRLGRPDVHAPVELHGVDAHQLDRWARQAPRHFQGEGGLARRRRSNQRQVGARGHPAGHAGLGQPAATGMRTLWRGRAVTSTSSPNRWWGAPWLMRTWAKVPAASGPSAAKWTRRLWRVRPVMRPASRLLTPSTSTSSTAPTRASLAASADRSTTTRSRSNRSPTTSAGTNRSAMVAASVPGRGEKTNV